ncbi:MAG: lipopolysaccharide biosynthesis protein [Spirochaetaceae bacterium]|nr:lipopolysaccharide biosynthesis protein [Spirochaetaceae bacterium]
MNDHRTTAGAGSVDPADRYHRVRDASIRGAGAGFVAFVAQTGLRIGSIAVLARLLTPDEFGVAAMATILLSLFTLVGDWGLTTAATQRVSVDADELSNLFWINTVVGFILAGATVLCSPLLALLFGEPRVTGAAMLLSITLIAIGCGAQHEAVLRRRLRYDLLQIVRVSSYVCGVSVGVGSALVGAGFWALIWMHLTIQIARTVLFWVLARWHPGRPKRGTNVRSIVNFATGLVPSRLILYLSRNAAPIMLGAAAGTTDLGLYNRASTAVMTPVSSVLDPLERVIPSSLSRLQEDRVAFRRLFKQTMMIAAFGGCGILGLVVAEAPAFVGLLLGDQWLSAIPLVRWLALAGLAAVIGKATGWILVPLGAAGKLVTVRLIRAGASVAGVIVGWQWGAAGIAAGYGVAALVSLVGEVVWATSGTPLRARALVEAAWRSVVCGLVAGSTVFLIRTELTLATLLLEVGLYCVLFIVGHALLPGGSLLMRTAREAVSVALSRQTAA